MRMWAEIINILDLAKSSMRDHESVTTKWLAIVTKGMGFITF